MGISMLEHSAPFADSPALHRHTDEDEIFHIFVPYASVHNRRARDRARAGEMLRAPKQTLHTYRVQSRDRARWLTITVQRRFERFVRAFGWQPTRAGLPDPSGPPTPAQAEAVKRRVGTTGSKSWGRLCFRRRGNLRFKIDGFLCRRDS